MVERISVKRIPEGKPMVSIRIAGVAIPTNPSFTWNSRMVTRRACFHSHRKGKKGVAHGGGRTLPEQRSLLKTLFVEGNSLSAVWLGQKGCSVGVKRKRSEGEGGLHVRG